MSGELEGWMDSALVSMEETANTFGFSRYELVERNGTPPNGLTGSFISLAGNVSKVQIGILSEVAAQEGVARIMLDMESEPVGTEDREDAMRELANIIAGGVKRGMFEHDSGLTLGLPVYVDGKLDAKNSVTHDVAKVMLGASQLNVVVLYERSS